MPIPSCQAIPRWHDLTPQLQASLLMQLTRLLQYHLGPLAPRAAEVGDDHH